MLALVTVNLPGLRLRSSIRIVHWERRGTGGRGGWFVGTTISQMSEQDAARLAAYIKKRSEANLYVRPA